MPPGEVPTWLSLGKLRQPSKDLALRGEEAGLLVLLAAYFDEMGQIRIHPEGPRFSILHLHCLSLGLLGLPCLGRYMAHTSPCCL